VDHVADIGRAEALAGAVITAKAGLKEPHKPMGNFLFLGPSGVGKTEMAKRSIIKKLSKEQKSLLIGLLLGDGTISSNYVFKLSHSEAQREFLEWKIDLLNKFGFKNNGVKEYISTCGYNKGNKVLYSQMSLNPTIKALRRTSTA
jgi:hypothetical protein